MSYKIIPPTNNPLLYQQIERYNFGRTDIHLATIVNDMIQCLKNSNNGYALAANQVGINLRAFVIGETVYINPEIIKSWGEQTGTEGCLSFPNEWIEKTRAFKVDVKFQDITGKVQRRTFTDLKARAFQHELDHLNGICFNDTTDIIQDRIPRRINSIRNDYRQPV
jgi:peptide deformylase